MRERQIPSPLTLATLGALLVGFAVVVVAKESGTFDAILAKRAIIALFGGALLVLGNLLPKLDPGLDVRGPGLAGQPERASGWLLVLTGVLLLLTTGGFASATMVPVAASVGVVGFLAVVGVVLWARINGHRPVRSSRHAAIWLGAIQVLFAIAWTLGMMVADAVWGDEASLWMLVAYIVVSSLIVPLTVTTAAEASSGTD